MATQILTVDRTLVDTSRFECVDGQLIARPRPNHIHSETQLAVTVLLRRRVKNSGLSALQEWTLDEDKQPRHNWMTPDVLVAAETSLATNGHCLPPAILAVEILSAGQTYNEMLLKAQRYFAWGVSHVWVIDPKPETAAVIAADNPESIQWFDSGRGALTAGDIRLSLEQIFSLKNSQLG